MTTVAAGGRVLLMGGLAGGAENLARVQAYEPHADEWPELAEMPGPLNHPAAAVVGDEAYLMGGSPLGGRPLHGRQVHGRLHL